jgi:hypothetical protein
VVWKGKVIIDGIVAVSRLPSVEGKILVLMTLSYEGEELVIVHSPCYYIIECDE